MSSKPLAEVYERLKELRRHGGLNPETQSRVGHQLRASLNDLARQGADWIRGFDAETGSDQSANLIRNLDIRTLADRVFGDEDKSEAWLNRPNPSLSGQKPVELLNDELGATVVRETLEQIDHGIFP